MVRTAAIAILVLGAAAGLAGAQLTERDLEPVGTPNAAYDRAAAGAGVQSEITYLRPSAPFKPDESVRIDVPDPAPEESEQRRAARWTYGLVFGAILIAILVLVLRHGGSLSVAFSSAPRDGRRDDDAAAEAAEIEAFMTQPLDRFLEQIRAMADRRAALILLVGRALERAADANDLRLGRAQTARDVIRVIPRGWPHREALHGLVRQAEIVHFGGRDLGEETWRDCLAAAEPIFRGARA